ncbi:Zn-dependent hydrolase [Halobacteriales archaeon QS_1_68_20]|nr:MAG: Zn-dependent hydrolase [Halobacteriales archaeon QS_1_68_20]
METVSESRLRQDLEANAEFGAIDADAGRGRTVHTGTEANRRARQHLVERMQDAGLDVTVDGVGNIAGTWTPESADPDAAPVAAGSHLDSVPEGGIFDGPLGVYAVLEAVRARQDAGVEPARPITVVSFTEEEGQRFASGLLGSSAAAGLQAVEEALMLRDDDGTTLREALASIDFLGQGRLDASEWDAWLELHVEQDTTLEEAGVPVGVVTTITGIAHYEATVEGEANHAGATAMGERRDALAAASEVVGDVERAAQEVVATDSETAVATVGSVDVQPNATNVVPGQVEMGIDVRDVRRETMDALADRVEKSLARVADARGVETTLAREMVVDPAPMSDRVRNAAHDAGNRLGIGTKDLPSGAAHDTMHVATQTDAALLFAPSRDGISHNPREWTDWADCATVTQVLAGTVADLAT